MRKAMELAERLSDESGDPRLDLPTLDELLQLTVDIYGNKFTLDDLYDGILADIDLSTDTSMNGKRCIDWQSTDMTILTTLYYS